MMTHIQKFITTLKKRITSPNVYAVELDCIDMAYLHLCIAYSLEEAMQDARKAILKDPTKAAVRVASWHLKKYAFRSLDDIVSETVTLEMMPGDAIVDKNTLMKKIIDTKDVNLFHENLSIFTEPEKRMLDDKLTQPENQTQTKKN